MIHQGKCFPWLHMWFPWQCGREDVGADGGARLARLLSLPSAWTSLSLLSPLPASLTVGSGGLAPGAEHREVLSPSSDCKMSQLDGKQPAVREGAGVGGAGVSPPGAERCGPATARLAAHGEALACGASESQGPAGGTPHVLSDRELAPAGSRKAKNQQRKRPGWERQCPQTSTRAGRSRGREGTRALA